MIYHDFQPRTSKALHLFPLFPSILFDSNGYNMLQPNSAGGGCIPKVPRAEFSPTKALSQPHGGSVEKPSRSNVGRLWIQPSLTRADLVRFSHET